MHVMLLMYACIMHSYYACMREFIFIRVVIGYALESLPHVAVLQYLTFLEAFEAKMFTRHCLPFLRGLTWFTAAG